MVPARRTALVTGADCKSMAADAIARFGAIDVLVDNDAIRPSDNFLGIRELTAGARRRSR